MLKLLVNNSRRVSKLLGKDVEILEDINQREDLKEWLEKYVKFFSNANPESIREFEKMTGLELAIEYHCRNTNTSILFTKIGRVVERNFPIKIFNQHITALYEVKSIEDIAGETIIDGVCVNYRSTDMLIDLLENTKNNQRISEEIQLATLEDKIELLIDYGYLSYNFDTTNIKDLFLSPYGDVYALYSDGKLLKNNTFYEEGVKDLWILNDKTSYIIFEDNNLEYITSGWIGRNRKLEKIVYTDKFMAQLDNNELEIYIKLEESQYCIDQIYEKVSDIEYNEETNELFVFSLEGGIITLDLDYSIIIK